MRLNYIIIVWPVQKKKTPQKSSLHGLKRSVSIDHNPLKQILRNLETASEKTVARALILYKRALKKEPRGAFVKIINRINKIREKSDQDVKIRENSGSDVQKSENVISKRENSGPDVKKGEMLISKRSNSDPNVQKSGISVPTRSKKRIFKSQIKKIL